MGLYVAPAPRSAPAHTVPAERSRFAGRLASGLLAIALLLAGVTAIGGALGYRGEVILTGSMRPALQPGDMVIADRVPARDLRRGDIVSFDDKGRTITHRVTQVRTKTDG